MDTTIKGLEAKTAEMNAAFDAADDAGKRVIIAQDVLAALKAKRIVAESGTYISLPTDDTAIGTYGEEALERLMSRDAVSPTGSFRDLLPILPPCLVCAKGALFVCTVARRNQVTNAEAFRSPSKWGGGEMYTLLGGIFSVEQLSLIEREFEGGAHDGGIDEGPTMGLFYEDEYDDRVPAYDDEERMTMIMQNIVRNGGTFVPGDGVIG